jgi:hypothetical protein
MPAIPAGIGPKGRYRRRFLPQGPRWRKHAAGHGTVQNGGKPPQAVGELVSMGPSPGDTGASRRLDGREMKGDQGKGAEKAGAGVKDSRRDRLKSALRENLKRRKSQARARDNVAASSESADVSLDVAGGVKPGS